MYPNNSPTPLDQPAQPSVPPVQPAATQPEYATQPQPFQPQAPQYVSPVAVPQQQYAPAQPFVVQPTKGSDPGMVMNIFGLVLALLLPLAGLPLSIIGYNMSKKAGANTVLGIVGIILNSAFILMALMILLLAFV